MKKTYLKSIPVTSVALDMLFAVTDTGVRVAAGLVPERTCLAAAAGLAAQGSEVEEVSVTAIALVAGDSSLALALALAVALQAARPC